MNKQTITVDELRPYCQGFSEDQLKQAQIICDRYQLSPVKRQIHFSLRNKKQKDDKGKEIWTKELSYLVTVDGLRGIAERGGHYEGQSGPFWCGKDGEWKDVWLSAEAPAAAKVGVFKRNFREALFAVAKFDEYKQTDSSGKVTGMWQKMSATMVAKCAEALALRRAFPDETSGIYTLEEMQQADNPPAQGVETSSAQGKTAVQHNDVDPRTFSMGGERDQGNPFKSSDQRKQWLVEAKADLDDVSRPEELDDWLAKYGANLKWLGNMQQKRMNEEIEEARVRTMEREMDQQAANRA